jgi:hypothetical protein
MVRRCHSSALNQHTAIGKEKTKMFNTKNLSVALAGLVLAIGVSLGPALAQQSTQAQQPMMSMSEMMQQMHHLMGETSRMANSMHGSSQGMGMRQMHGMMDMSHNMNRMAGIMNNMTSELNGMMSNQQMMNNPQFRSQIEKMRQHMASMMKNLDAMVGNMKTFNVAPKK